jgi:hypothetical protein
MQAIVDLIQHPTLRWFGISVAKLTSWRKAMSRVRRRGLRVRLAALAEEIRQWDADRQRISHVENHEGGAVSQWHGSDDWAVQIVRSAQDILGAPAKAIPAKFCRSGPECEDCAAIED